MNANIEGFITERLIAFRDNQEMWGTREAVERQAIQLIEIEAFVKKGEISRFVFDTYMKFVALYMKNITPSITEPYNIFDHRPLYLLIEEQRPSRSSEFSKILWEICQEVRRYLELIH